MAPGERRAIGASGEAWRTCGRPCGSLPP